MSGMFRRIDTRWRCVSFILMFFILCLSVALVVTIVYLSDSEDDTSESSQKVCGSSAKNSIDLSEPEDPDPFHRLTRKEMKGIREYLQKQESLTLVEPEEIILNSTYIFTAELFQQPKEDILNYLDKGGQTYVRSARVVLFRGDLEPPVIEELEVGLLPNPTYHKLINSSSRNPVEFAFRPLTAPSVGTFRNNLRNLDSELGDILMENYEAKFYDCDGKCLAYTMSFITSGVTKTKTRLMWIWLTHAAEYRMLHPLDMAFLFNMTSSETSEHAIEKVWFRGQLYDSIDHLKQNYTKPDVSPRIPFPKVSNDYFSTLNLRGEPRPNKPMSGPRQIEPDGKRYSIKHQRISYLGWDLSFRVNIRSGPQLCDVRYEGERIAYEISLQEIAVLYSGSTPHNRYADYIDSYALLGKQAKTLVPGADCPEHATFIENVIMTEGTSQPISFKHGSCVFEHNNGIPMRRHSTYTQFNGKKFYSGMPDNVLIIRTILTVSNYDYFVDFILHQGGALEVKAVSTGYISSEIYSSEKYGFPLHGRITGAIHHHMFNFKVDLDIAGTANRFETLDVKVETVTNEPWSEEDYYQTKVERSLKQTEREAAYKFDFEAPKYLLIKNQNSTTKTGITKSYRIHPVGFTKQVLPEGSGNEPTIAWSRYQVAVTRRHDSEPTSSSFHAGFDAGFPVVDFESYIADNEGIVDEDLVAWVTMGVHHIPHTEDLPVTPTVGGHLAFFLLPYNYFDEDASMSSRDAIRVEFKNDHDPKEGVRVERYGNTENKQCVAPKTNFDEAVNSDPSIVLGLY